MSTATYSDGTRTLTVNDGEVVGPYNWPVTGTVSSASIKIIGLTASAVKVYGDHTSRFVSTMMFSIINGSNSGTFTVTGSTFDGTITTISVSEAVTTSLPYGSISYVVPSDETVLSLTVIGNHNPLLVDIVNQNFLHLLENFAADTAPPSPTIGQLWFDTTTNSLRVYDGSAFASSVVNDLFTQTDADARYVKLAGSTMTGALILAADPTDDLGAATKQYVDDQVSAAVAYKYITAFFSDDQLSDELLLRIVMPIDVTLPISAPGSYFSSTSNATATRSFSIAKNGTEIGTIDVTSGSASGTFTIASAVSFSAGDVLTVIAPTTTDAAFIDVSLTIKLTQ